MAHSETGHIPPVEAITLPPEKKVPLRENAQTKPVEEATGVALYSKVFRNHMDRHRAASKYNRPLKP